MKIAIQGDKGSYHEQAMTEHYGDLATSVYCTSFNDVFDAVINEKADAGVVAIANNRFGFIPQTYALIVDNAGRDVRIVGEHTIKVSHQLLAAPGAKIEQITKVYSQAPAFGQCTNFMQSTLPNAVRIETSDTALAAKQVSELGNAHWAAIASESAGKLYGLEALEDGIQDDANNLTRFLVIAKSSSDQKYTDDCNKTSILLRTGNHPGALLRPLQLLAGADISMSLLSSSFVANSGFSMQFWVDINAGWRDPRLQGVVEGLRQDASMGMDLLGTYREFYIK